jgi:GNAT superfamily N-acetyltransferase
LELMPIAMIRPATERDVDAIARVHVESWRSTYQGIVPDAYLAGLRVEDRAAMWRRVLGEYADVHAVFVAEMPDAGVVGFASSGPTRDNSLPFDRELYAIYLLAEWHGRGLGRQLIRAIVADLAALGTGSLCLWVLAANPSRGFYERLGGRALRTQQIEIGGATLDEVAYGWDDLMILLAGDG